MGVTTTLINKPFNPRGNDQSPKGYNRAALYSGKALDFDGVNDYVDCGTLDVTAYTAISVAMYLSKDTTSTQLPFSLRHTGNDDIRIVTESNNVQVVVDDGTAYTLSHIVPLSTMLFVVLTFDGSTLKGYVNGNEFGSMTASFDFSTADGALRIGERVNGSLDFDGQIANTKVFNTALTAAQVADLYNNPEKVVPTGVDNTALKLWLPMMEGAGTTAYDGSGNGNHGTISGATYVNGIGAPVAQSAVMDWNKYSITDTTDYANVSSTTIVSEGTIVFKHVPLADVGNTYFLSYGTGLTGQSRSIRQYLGNYEFIGWGSPNVHDKTTSEALEVGVIKNVAYTWDASGNVKVYINGSKVLDDTLTLNTLTSSKVGVNIAPTHSSQMSNQIMFYAGLYDEVLTESQIQDIQDGTTNPESVSGLVHFWRNSNDWQDEVGSADLTENDNAGKVLFPQTLTNGRDLAGNTFANVRKQGALNLDGNSWAEVHDNASLDITSAITLEAWVYWDSTQTATGILGKWNSSSTQCYLIYSASSSRAQFYISTTGSNAQNVEYSIPSDGWVHIVGTDDGTNQKLYINGAEEATTSSLGSIFESALPLEIGRYNESTAREYGDQIAQPRIYNRALTAEEVQRNYNAGKNTYTN